jgi:hypothetical protein
MENTRAIRYEFRFVCFTLFTLRGQKGSDLMCVNELTTRDAMLTLPNNAHLVPGNHVQLGRDEMCALCRMDLERYAVARAENVVVRTHV